MSDQTFEFDIIDSQSNDDEATKKTVVVKPDAYGCIISVKGSPFEAMLYYSGGEIKVFHGVTGDELGEPVGNLDTPGRFEDIELSDGGCFEAPEEDDGTIRRRDVYGNCEDVIHIDDDNWDELAGMWNLTKSDFQTEV